MCIGELVHAILSTHYMQAAAAVWLGSSYSYSWYGLWNLLMQSTGWTWKISLSIFVILMQKYLEPRMKMILLIPNNKCEWKKSPLKKKNQKVICIYRFSPFFKQRKAVVALLCFFWRLSDYFSYIQQHPLPYNTFYHFQKYVLRQFFKQLNIFSLFLSNQN